MGLRAEPSGLPALSKAAASPLMLTPRLLSAASRAPQVGFWLALLPLSVYSVDISWNHLVTIPCCMAITFFLLGIEELERL